MKITHYGNVDRKRAQEYPPLQRQIDLLWRALKEVHPHPFSTEIEAMLREIEKVKTKYPDPPKEPHEA